LEKDNKEEAAFKRKMKKQFSAPDLASGLLKIP